MSWLSDVEGRYDDYDEESVRSRPNPKANRPRTKRRPTHDQAVTGMVVGVDRGRYRVQLEATQVTASRARELRKQAIVAGDRVDLVGDTSGEEGTLARIVRVLPRTSVLRRSADDSDQVERVIVANADLLLIVVAAANPEPRPRLIDRYLVAAYDAGIRPLLAVTKTDLASSEPLLDALGDVDLEVFAGGLERFPVDELTKRLRGHTTVLVGHSGVGKSTLINRLVPGAGRATGHVNAVTGRGRHTSSSARALRLPLDPAEPGADPGWIVDTPGVRSFGLGHVRLENVLRAFPDLEPYTEECPRGCTHLADAPGCGLTVALEEGALSPRAAARLDSLRRLLATLTEADAAPDR